ncbi:MAG: RluA family pseudouridine synthase [Saprospiraceae bacterium]
MLKVNFQVLYEDNHLLVVNKPSNLLSQGDHTGDACLLDLAKEYIKEKYQKPGKVFLELVHRLDRPTSGVLCLARTSKGLERIQAQFRQRTVEKFYFAVVSPVPGTNEAYLEHYHWKDRERNRVYLWDTPEHKDAVKVRMAFQIRSKKAGMALLQIKLHTGKSHQIRAQLSHIGSPVVGDEKYGIKSDNQYTRSLALHACELRMDHPTRGERMTFFAEPPAEDPWDVFATETRSTTYF